jgi:alpha-galactosidase
MAQTSEDQDKHEHEVGHGAHTHDAELSGLPGKTDRPIKVTMMGAGSAFTPRLANDILRIPNNQGGTLALVDIDAERLNTMRQLLEKLIAEKGFKNWNVIGSTQRREVMGGSDYITNCIEVSGTACVRFDNDIPKKYGIDQCIGDTIGPGGLFKSLRTIPVFLQVLRDAEELCPSAIVLNYTNPMNMLILASSRVSPVSVVGLCHSVQGTSELLSKRVDVPYAEMEWECAGINHLAWFTKLKHKGEDLYPRLKELAAKEIAQAIAEGPEGFEREDEYTWKVPEHHRDLVRKDMMLHFGAFITESSGHLSEYLPYYRTNEKAMRDYMRPGYDGTSSFYADNWPTWRTNADAERNKMLSGESPMEWERSWEYASWIIEAREKNVPHRIHGNVMNNAGGSNSTLISNLPADGCVEVACLIDRNGVQPVRYGKLPPQMAALCDWNMRMFDLGAQAAIEKSKELAIHALMLDPLSAAMCTPAQIKAMTLEMFDAEAEFLPDYK